LWELYTVFRDRYSILLIHCRNCIQHSEIGIVFYWYIVGTVYSNTIPISECCIQFPQCINRILYLSLNAVYSSHNVSIQYYTYLWDRYSILLIHCGNCIQYSEIGIVFYWILGYWCLMPLSTIFRIYTHVSNTILYLSLNTVYSSHNVSIEYYTYLWMLYTVPTMYQYNTIPISEYCILHCRNCIQYSEIGIVLYWYIVGTVYSIQR
jgi:hypothetical protein